MTPGARRVLQDLADDETCDMIQEGWTVYCGDRQTTIRVVTELLGLVAISILFRDGFVSPTTYYGINDIGHAMLRRPELEEELRRVLYAKRPRPFQVIDDRIVFI